MLKDVLLFVANNLLGQQGSLSGRLKDGNGEKLHWPGELGQSPILGCCHKRLWIFPDNSRIFQAINFGQICRDRMEVALLLLGTRLQVPFPKTFTEKVALALLLKSVLLQIHLRSTRTHYSVPFPGQLSVY